MKTLTMLFTFLLVTAAAAAPKVSIIGGEEISTEQAPWQLSLKSRIGGSHYCGAVLVGERLILTAAHCIYRQSASELKIYGSSRSGHVDSLTRLPSASQIILHPDFDPDAVTSHDIAIIRLSRSVKVSETLKPVALPGVDSPFQIDQQFHQLLSYPLAVTGWGATTPPNRFPTASEDLMRAWVKPLASSNVSLENPDIQKYLEETYDIGPRMRARISGDNSRTLLTEGLRGLAGSCSGDSGGPLVMSIGNQFLLVGISSYTAGGERRCKGVSVYTNVQAYVQWISQVISFAG